MRHVLLISNSTLHGGGYLDHCEEHVQEFLRAAKAPVKRVLFVPYALHDRDAYFGAFRDRVQRMGLEADSLHSAAVPRQAVEEAEAVFVGGGNTFRLLNELYTQDVLEPIRRRVQGGMPYLGTSAGSNVGCITIKTTNDMPIVQPPSFDALGLVSFNINAHYIDPDPGSTHMGETREKRIAEFHEMNEVPVVGLREGAMLRVEGDAIRLQGTRGARLFRRGQEGLELENERELKSLLEP